MDTSYTFTCGDQGENHAGMQMIGDMATLGFTSDDLELAKQKFDNTNECVLINLNDALDSTTKEKYPDIPKATFL